MQIYKLKRDTYFTLEGEKFMFKKIDGMYAICLDDGGKINYIAAYLDVVPEENNDI